MSVQDLTTNSNFSEAVQLKYGAFGSEDVFDMRGTTVQTRLVSLDRETALSAVVTLDENETGANFAESLVMVVFEPADTVDITYQGLAYCEISVDDGEETNSYFADINIIRGNIP